MTINPQTAPIAELKAYAKEVLKIRIAHNASELNVRKKVAEAMPAAPAPVVEAVKPETVEPPVTVTPPAEEQDEPDAPAVESKKLDRTKPFGIVRGEPGVAYFQFGECFNVNGELVTQES